MGNNAHGINSDYGLSVAVGASNNPHIVGYSYSSILTFGSSALVKEGAWYTTNMYLAKLENSDGINETNYTSIISVYPNPVSEKVTIETRAQCQLSILTLTGQPLITRHVTEAKTVVDISTLPSGVYIVKVVGEKGVQVGKILKK